MEFTLYWLDGKKEVIEGDTITQAMNNVGYGQGSLRALDFHAEGQNNDYKFVNNQWTWTDIKKEKMGITSTKPKE